MKWTKVKEANDGGLSIPENWLHIHYYDALSSLFRIENALRTFVFLVLKTEAGESWPDLEISSDDGSKTTIKSLAKKRIAQNETFGYLAFNINSPLMHLTSGELVGLIIAESYWPYFKRHFRAAKHVVTLKLQEIGNIRNSLAHFRPIREDDVEVVKQNANQVLSGVERSLSEAIKCSNRVPTNTDVEWYRELCTLGTEYCHFTFCQSQDLNWIRLTLHFRCSSLSGPTDEPSNFAHYDGFTFDTPASLIKFKNIQQNVSILSETIIFPGWQAKRSVTFGKDLKFTFGAKVIAKHYAKIKTDFEELLSLITKEIELITEDNQAQGDLIRLVDIQAYEKETKAKSYWVFKIDPLIRKIKADDPPEYWGNFDLSGDNPITDSEKFPWMPVDISKHLLPF